MIMPESYTEDILTPKTSRSIEAVWSFTAQHAGESTVLPDGRCDLIIRFSVHNSAPLIPIITGPSTEAYDVSFEPGDAWVGLRLRPFQGSMLWGTDIITAKNKTLKGQAALDMFPSLSSLSHVKPTIPNIISALPPMLQNHDPFHDVMLVNTMIESVHASGGRLSIASLAHSLCYTPRHLNRVFFTSVGLTIKLYSSLIQFHRCLRLLAKEKLSFADAALEAGYSDQAHMGRSMRKFSGFTPSQLPHDLTLPNLFA